MKMVSRDSVKQLSPREEDMIYDPPGEIGYTQALFLAMTPKTIPLAKGVYRFKTHEAMNAQWEEVERKIFHLQKQNTQENERP